MYKVKLHTVCQMILQPAEYALFGNRIFITVVNDGETRQVPGRNIIFFNIHSRKAKQYGFLLQYDADKKLVFLGDESVDRDREHYITGADWLLSVAFCLSAEEEDLLLPLENLPETRYTIKIKKKSPREAECL